MLWRSFDGNSVTHKLPEALIHIRNRRFNYDRDMLIEVALPSGVERNVRNALFDQSPQLTSLR